VEKLLDSDDPDQRRRLKRDIERAVLHQGQGGAEVSIPI